MIYRKYTKLLLLITVAMLVCGTVWNSRVVHIGGVEAAGITYEDAASYDNSKKARAAFNDAAKVFFSARCINCHPGGDTPLQGDDGRVHDNGIMRGADGKGVDPLLCSACHTEKNIDGEDGSPGAADWRMPPDNNKMVFQGVTAGELCRQLKDPARNGGHNTAKDAIKHIETDPRVSWAWSPGNKRSVPPMEFDEFVKKMNVWAANGAACPDK